MTIPVLSLLGVSDEPATLDGYGPIDLDTAKRLAGSAKSWVRILTHPVTGTILDVDWQYGGKTAATSLAPECEPHHRLRHESNWTVTKDPDTGEITWTSPTGHTTHDDPPPF